MSFGKKDYERVKKSFRRTWEISPETRVTPLKKHKQANKKVDWQAELDAYEEEMADEENGKPE